MNSSPRTPACTCDSKPPGVARYKSEWGWLTEVRSALVTHLLMREDDVAELLLRPAP